MKMHSPHYSAAIKSWKSAVRAQGKKIEIGLTCLGDCFPFVMVWVCMLKRAPGACEANRGNAEARAAGGPGT